MTNITKGPAAPTAGGRPSANGLVVALALTQTVGYGVLYYSFAVVLIPIAHDLRTSTATVAGALTTAILVGAVAAVPIGRWLDRHGGRAIMTAGSVLGVVAVAAWSQVQQVWQLYAVFVAIGLASAASLYEAAFPVVVATSPPGQRDRRLLVVTVVAGFASSIFFPLTGFLLDSYGWRTTLLVLAGALAVVVVPAHAVMVPLGRVQTTRRESHVDGNTIARVLRDGHFWRTSGAFFAHTAAVAAVSVLLIGHLRWAGHTSTAAALLAGLLGVLSVTGRLVTAGLARHHGMASVAAVVFGIQAAGLLALPLVGRSTLGAAACVVAFGLGFGVATIARPAIVADRYGTERYATIAATIAVPMAVSKAFAAPLAASVAPNAFLATAGGLCLLSGVLLWSTRRGLSRSVDPPAEEPADSDGVRVS